MLELDVWVSKMKNETDFRKFSVNCDKKIVSY